MKKLILAAFLTLTFLGGAGAQGIPGQGGMVPCCTVPIPLILTQTWNTAVDASNTSDLFFSNLTASQTGGTAGAVQAAVHGRLFINANVASYGWAGLFEVHNNTTGTLGNSVGVYGQGNFENSAGGPTWGGVFEGADRTGGSTASHLFGVEVDIKGNGADVNANRYGIVIVPNIGTGTDTGTTIQAGLRLGGISGSTGGAPNNFAAPNFVHAIEMAGPMTTGLDFTKAVGTSNGAFPNAINIATSQTLAFDGAAAAVGHYLVYTSGSGFQYIDGNGNIGYAVGDAAASSPYYSLYSAGASGSIISTRGTNATNGNLTLQSFNAGNILLGTSSSGIQARVIDLGSAAADYLTLRGGVTGSPGTVALGAGGSDANVNISISPKGTGQVVIPTQLQVGTATQLTLAAGEQGFAKIAASSSAPGALGAKIAFVCGTNAGSAKLIAYAGTSTTPVTVIDNIGSGVTGC